MGRKRRTSRPTPPSPNPPTTQPEELDLEAFSRSLHTSGLCIRDVSNDGNCFFRAVSDQLYGTEEYHIKLRERACDYLQTHKSHYRHFVDDEQSFDDYVADMRNDGVWADNLELQAISMAYNVNIRIHQSGKPSYDIFNHTAKNARAIHLSYHFGEHYASVRPLHSADLTLPAQHDPLSVARSPAHGVTSEQQQQQHHHHHHHHQSPPSPPSPQQQQQQNSAQERSSSRRPRQKKTFEDDIKAAWRKVDRGHCDLCDLVDHTRRAARVIRYSDAEYDGMDEKREAARRIEREMKEVRTKLADVEKAIVDGQRTTQFPTKSNPHLRRNQFQPDVSESDPLCDCPNDTEEEEEQYRKAVRRETDEIFERLNEIEGTVRVAREKFAALSVDAAQTKPAKPVKGAKRKEREARKRDRKERRRREQERVARGEEDIRVLTFSHAHELDIAI